MSTLSFVKTARAKGSREIGFLYWEGERYRVVTGGYGKGAIPDGEFTIRVRQVAVGTKENMLSGFVNPLNGRGWFIPLTPNFATSRFGFGIHPDGNLPGTKGCLGLQGNDTEKFWKRWCETKIDSRPTLLQVTTDYASKETSCRVCVAQIATATA
ncbi:hypothetical protein [Vibrio sp. 10N]|uniref:hypothetical protein n=1 Tax=Vibrio sp. 10N TaxID=3058938 RepID=UPI0028138378|nr:hypothetical protein VB10N_01860 [Vibrio sp. 10N]